MRLPLEIRAWKNPYVSGPVANWRESEPFVENRRGILVHRPRFVRVYQRDGKPAHIVVEYYCGNCVTDNAKRAKLTFCHEPPIGLMVCAVCEHRAVMAGLPTSTTIAGRHVHTGKLKAVMTCCPEDAE